MRCDCRACRMRWRAPILMAWLHRKLEFDSTLNNIEQSNDWLAFATRVGV